MEPDRSLRLAIWEGALSVLFLSWSTGVILTGYALALGASPQALALLGGLPFLAQLLAPLALFLGGSRKSWSLRLNLLSRSLFLPAILAPFLPEAYWVPSLLVFAGISQLLAAPVGVLWLSWMADLVPEEKRGRYFGLRNALLGLVATLGNLLGGAVADHLPPPTGYQAVLLLGVALGLLALLLLRLQAEPPPPAGPAPLPTLLSAWKDRSYRRYLSLVLGWYLAVMVGGPYVVPYFLEVGGLSMTQVGLWTVLSAVSGLFFGPMWGRLADREGHGKVLFRAGLVAALMPLLWLSGSQAFPWPIWLAAVADALAWSGLNTALVNVVLARSPANLRSGYLALFWLALGLGGLLGSLLAGQVARIPLGPSPYHTLLC
ncbi:Major Facilitator Superfamily protein [Thermus arciformis]|uniref:Major Facilitator Superfamily protein n=1 Tax=Thermus arciformis TaxID=482827 RepID=A0A1G7L2E1_9DEIN|nr:MFS transporter [Thermus arciformis]SDF43635.1 Major Facilitator Superfamily protein [Thermus arciformis]